MAAIELGGLVNQRFLQERLCRIWTMRDVIPTQMNNAERRCAGRVSTNNLGTFDVSWAEIVVLSGRK
jgi:hypothetical protein